MDGAPWICLAKLEIQRVYYFHTIMFIVPAAYVLINCELGSEEEIINELKSLPSVIEVNASYGVYDIIVKIGADTIDNLRETITWRIRRLDKIKSTLTLIIVDGQNDK